MKKFSKIILSVLLCVLCAISFVACGETPTPTSADSTDVVSNGGVALKHNGYLYFIGGTYPNDGDSNTAITNLGSIYKAKLDESGEVIVDSNGNFSEVSQVVSSLAGFNNGTINIFGDHLYYTTPNTAKNNKAVTLNYQTCFMRLDLLTGATENIFTTSLNNSKEEVTYAYYNVNGSLYLVVYEKVATTLTSVKVDTNPTVNVIATNAQTAIFSENDGVIQDANRNSIAENYVFFTRAALTTGAVRTGSRVYKVLPTGAGETLLSEGKNVSLLTIRADKLVYSYDSRIFAQKITDSTTEKLAFTSNQVISEKTYDSVVFVENGDNIGLLYYKDGLFRYIEYVDGVESDPNTDLNRTIYELDTAPAVTLVAIDGGYLYYFYTDMLYRIHYENEANEIVSQEQLSSTVCAEINGSRIPEVIDGYIYFFSETADGSSSKPEAGDGVELPTHLYRVLAKTRDDDGSVLSVKKGTLIK